MINKKVTIVTISFNQARFLEQAMCSVFDQDYSNIEYIVVDPGSTDGSRDIIKKYGDKISRIIFSPDTGPADGLNKGFAVATGDIFGFLNADDYLLPGSISTIVNCFQKRNDINVLSGHGYYVDEAGNILRGFYSHRIHRLPYAYGAVVLVQQSTFFKKEIFKEVGGFNPENRTCWDGELWADMILKNARFGRIHAYLSAFRIHGTSITGSQKFQLLLEQELAHIRHKLGVANFSPFLRKILWLINRTSDPKLLWLQILNGLNYGFASPIPK